MEVLMFLTWALRTAMQRLHPRPQVQGKRQVLGIIHMDQWAPRATVSLIHSWQAGKGIWICRMGHMPALSIMCKKLCTDDYLSVLGFNLFLPWEQNSVGQYYMSSLVPQARNSSCLYMFSCSPLALGSGVLNQTPRGLRSLIQYAMGHFMKWVWRESPVS